MGIKFKKIIGASLVVSYFAWIHDDSWFIGNMIKVSDQI